MQVKMKKVKITINVDGEPKEVEIEVPDTGEEGWGDVSDTRYLGKHVQRLDGAEKVTGRAKYTYDLNLPGMLYGRILRSAHPRARVVKIDASKAAALPGVKAVLLPKDEPDLFSLECRYAGQEVAAVAATSSDIAEDALKLIEVQYEELPFVVEVERAMQPGAAQVHSDMDNIADTRVNEQGDVSAAFAAAEVMVEATYRNAVQSHISLETHGTVSQWNGDSLTVWASTQGVFSVRDELAQYFKIPATKVRVITEYMGGGFGSKFGARREGVIGAVLAKKTGVPVKLMLTRKEEHLTTGNRPDAVQQVQIGARKDGTLVAYRRSDYNTGGIAKGASLSVRGPYLYTIPNFRVEQKEVYINAGPFSAQRAPSHPQVAFAMESIMDELAEKLGMDAIALRQKNDPSEARRKMVEMGAERIGWERRNKTPGAGAGTKKRGIGMGSCVWGGGGGRTQAEVVINPDGSVEVRCGTQDLGTGTKTMVAIIAAEEFGLTPQEINARIGDTNFPPSGGSGGSTTCASVSPAIKTTSLSAKMQLFEVVAPRLGVTADKLVARDGKVYVKDDPSKSVTWKQAAAQLKDPLVVQGRWLPGYSDSGVPGVQFVEVEVDTETGVVKVLKVVAVHDSGLVISRLTWESQINGGVLMGLGYALYEQRILDPRVGHMVNPNLEDYRVVAAMEVPEIEILEYPEPHRGAIGIGEPATIPTTVAIANAIYNACGVRLRETPMTPDKVLMALAERKEG